MAWVYRFLFPSGKSYVGQTQKRRARDRWRAHKTRANDASAKADWPVYRAIRKYGWHNIKKSIVGRVEWFELDECEEYFIRKFDSYHNGYNLTPGGDKNPMKTESCRLKMKETCSTPEHKAAVSKRIKNLHADDVWKADWLTKQRASHRTDDHRAGQGERSKNVWAKEKAAGKDRGVAIKKALTDPEYKAKLAAKRATPEYKAMQKARTDKIKATYARRKAERTGSQYAACEQRVGGVV